MILQSYIKQFRTSTRNQDDRYRFYALNVNQRLNAIGATEITVTHDESTFIDNLRGLNGLRAKRQAFEYAIAHCDVTYDVLINAFPNHFTSH